TLYFQHVAGLFDETLKPSWSLASEYSPGARSLAEIDASVTPKLTVSQYAGYRIAYSPRGIDEKDVALLASQSGIHRYATGAVVDGQGSVMMIHSAGGTVQVKLKSPSRVTDLLSGHIVCTTCTTFSLQLNGAETRVFNVEAR
ncbi:MAG: hypothetical protein V4692_04345, partial [Bdellovibrionota bacterium]